MPSEITYYPATDQDYDDLSMFISFEYYVHRHLDWRSSLDWLGKQPFWIAKTGGEIIGCYAAAVEPAQTAWVRLFACSALYSRKKLWEEFFQRSLKQYDQNVVSINALGVENWFANLMKTTSFELAQKIIVYEWAKQPISYFELASPFSIRKMHHSDIEQVFHLDADCFEPEWQMSTTALDNALNQAGYAAVIEDQTKIIGYQITTEALSSAHLARIAIDPAYQGHKLGQFILNDLLIFYENTDISRLTVNTQSDNIKSQGLYEKSGFQLLDEEYPVYRYNLR